MNSYFQQFKHDFAGKKVLILGLGLQGRGTGDAEIFSKIGCEVVVTDLKTEEQLKSSIKKLKNYPITFHLGEHRKEDIAWADVIVRNASVPWKHPLLEYARDLEKQIVMDTALLLQYLPKSVITIGITGTRGKSTTTHVTHQLLSSIYGERVIIAGNVPGIASLSILENFSTDSIIVLELSSWQLQGMREQQVSPHIALITNIYPDHLNKTENFEEYALDKAVITQFQTAEDYLLINEAQDLVRKVTKDTAAQVKTFSQLDTQMDEIPNFIGQHNCANISGVKLIASTLGITTEVITKHIKESTPLENRLQKISDKNGITVYNDTTSTTPISVIVALDTVENPILIMGGTDKQLPLDEMVEKVNKSAKKVLLLSGNGTDRIKDKIDEKLLHGVYDDFEQSIKDAFALAKPGDAILFSPGFTSFGMFENEFDRGRQFTTYVSKYA